MPSLLARARSAACCSLSVAISASTSSTVRARAEATDEEEWSIGVDSDDVRGTRLAGLVAPGGVAFWYRFPIACLIISGGPCGSGGIPGDTTCAAEETAVAEAESGTTEAGAGATEAASEAGADDRVALLAADAGSRGGLRLASRCLASRRC